MSWPPTPTIGDKYPETVSPGEPQWEYTEVGVWERVPIGCIVEVNLSVGENDSALITIENTGGSDVTLEGATQSLAGLLTAENQTIGGVKTFGSIPLLPSTPPQNSNQVASKGYVDTRQLGNLNDVTISVPQTGATLWYDNGVWKNNNNIKLTSGGNITVSKTVRANEKITINDRWAIEGKDEYDPLAFLYRASSSFDTKMFLSSNGDLSIKEDLQVGGMIESQGDIIANVD